MGPPIMARTVHPMGPFVNSSGAEKIHMQGHLDHPKAFWHGWNKTKTKAHQVHIFWKIITTQTTWNSQSGANPTWSTVSIHILDHAQWRYQMLQSKLRQVNIARLRRAREKKKKHWTNTLRSTCKFRMRKSSIWYCIWLQCSWIMNRWKKGL